MNTDWTYVIVLAGIIGAAFYVMRRFASTQPQGYQAMGSLRKSLKEFRATCVLKSAKTCAVTVRKCRKAWRSFSKP